LGHLCRRVCQEYGIERWLTKIHHPWTKEQGQMNRTSKEATVSRYHDQTHRQPWQCLYQFLLADNFAKRLKTLPGLTPYEYILK
jgi:hypothetical protein